MSTVVRNLCNKMYFSYLEYLCKTDTVMSCLQMENKKQTMKKKPESDGLRNLPSAPFVPKDSNSRLLSTKGFNYL